MPHTKFYRTTRVPSEEAITFTTPAPEMRMIMKEMEEISDDRDRREPRKRALPHTLRRRTKHKIKWPQFS